jgi:transketolase
MEDGNKNQKLSTKEIELKANDIRNDIISMLLEAKSGHTAGPLGMADVFAALYFNILKHNPADPTWAGRDRLVLSCGHICPVLYATLAESGYFPKEELMTLRKLGSRLQGHPHNLSLPGIENTSGPLAQGISQAVGMAIAAKMDHAQHRIYCISSDGEQDEGQVWEALMLAGKHRLNNLTLILDRNNIQIDGYTEDVMPLEPLRAKYEAFNWHVIEIDGNNVQEVINACNEAKAIFEKPVLIMAHTIPGKGVGFMEFNYEWHGTAPKSADAEKALAELRTMRGAIQSEHQ